MDSFIASGILNRMKSSDWNIQITCPSDTVTSMNGVTIKAQQQLEYANTADVVLFGSGIYTRNIAKDKTIKLPAVVLKTITPFVSIIFTPLDNKDLIKSKHILITAMARDKQTGSKYNADQSKLLTIGGPPLLMEPVQATIRLKGAKPKEINVLDIYGVPTGKKVKLNSNGSFKIDGTYQTYYYEIKR